MSSPSASVNVRCSSCAKSFKVPRSCLDRRITCPYCFKDAHTPHPQDAGTNGFPIPTSNAPHSSMASPQVAERVVKINCESCGATLEVPEREYESMAGKTYPCPSCKLPCTLPRLCPKCGATCAANAGFCPTCGCNLLSKLQLLPSTQPPAASGFVPCPRCQAAMPPNAVFCPACGFNYQFGGTGPMPMRPVAPPEPADHPGIGRAAYFGLSLLVGLVAVFFLGLLGLQDPAVGGFVIAAASIALAANRFRNMGMSGWWSLLIFLPLVNVVVQVMLLVCQPGYTQTNRLDAHGKLVLWILVGSILVGVLIFVAFMNEIISAL